MRPLSGRDDCAKNIFDIRVDPQRIRRYRLGETTAANRIGIAAHGASEIAGTLTVDRIGVPDPARCRDRREPCESPHRRRRRRAPSSRYWCPTNRDSDRSDGRRPRPIDSRSVAETSAPCPRGCRASQRARRPSRGDGCRRNWTSARPACRRESCSTRFARMPSQVIVRMTAPVRKIGSSQRLSRLSITSAPNFP